ncbi:hypothetical protein BZA05DRAFT_392046 [Tricharina praecox]|uniref:uncharacterized protein n=1 Tax=Tricharina praecox TaxID=43433 RepID=UPI00221EFA9A|nr:uncharacterized protein BZA05DRAFT_392046 [Tricharina praecox]KAI5854608.1 hypothetical protein BZA05DRAFT_392046 [Tricharina praecox]
MAMRLYWRAKPCLILFFFFVSSLVLESEKKENRARWPPSVLLQFPKPGSFKQRRLPHVRALTPQLMRAGVMDINIRARTHVCRVEERHP